jgi:hypothetical protein
MLSTHASLHHRKFLGRKLSERISRQLSSEGQHRYGSRRGPRRRQTQLGGTGSASGSAGSLDERASAEGAVRGV